MIHLPCTAGKLQVAGGSHKFTLQKKNKLLQIFNFMFVYMCVWGGGYNKTITSTVHDKFPYQAKKNIKEN